MADVRVVQGLIANGDQQLIDLVHNLVVKYIKGNCLILVALTVGGQIHVMRAICEWGLTVPCPSESADDLENQSAAHIAREQDPSGERTIGEQP